MFVVSCLPILVASADLREEFPGYAWYIPEYNVDMSLSKTGTLSVKETITVDFSSTSRRGIIREIPYEFGELLNKRSTSVDVKSVTDLQGNEWDYQVSKSDGYVNIRIGDPEVYLSEEVVYVIDYTTDNILNSFDENMQFLGADNWGDEEAERIELYWNAIGNEWSESPIGKYEINLDLSEFGELDVLDNGCFTGVYGSRENCQIEEVGAGLYRVSGESLGYQKGVTLGTAFNPEAFDINFAANLFWANVGIASILLYPLLVFFGFFVHWYRHGKEPDKNVIVPYFKLDEDMGPMEIGTLVDERLDMKDVSAGIIDLSLRGYLKIVEVEKKGLFSKNEVKFVKLKEFENDESLKKHEKDILKGLFKSNRTEATVDDLEGSFYIYVGRARESVFTYLTREKYYHANPKDVKSKYLGIGSVFAFGVLWFAMAFQLFFLLYIFLPVGLSAIFFSFFMAKKTDKGMRAYEKILGFKDFIEIAEKDRLEFFQTLKDETKGKDGEIKLFEKLLPYAMAVGLGDKWSGIFEEIFAQGYNPAWYSTNGTGLRMNDLNRSLSSINRSVSSAAVPPSSSGSSGGSYSGGGGFSGGGFGGGGGSSW